MNLNYARGSTYIFMKSAASSVQYAISLGIFRFKLIYPRLPSLFIFFDTVSFISHTAMPYYATLS